MKNINSSLRETLDVAGDEIWPVLWEIIGAQIKVERVRIYLWSVLRNRVYKLQDQTGDQLRDCLLDCLGEK